MAGFLANTFLMANRRIIVGTGDLMLSEPAAVTLTTYSLGSCVAVVLYDQVNHAGGVLHFMLPDSSIAPDRAMQQPALFADTGIALLLKKFASVQSGCPRLRVYLAGGACVLAGPDLFRIGARNATKARTLVEAAGVPIIGTDLGGTISRSLHLDLPNGQLSIKLPDRTQQVSML